MNIYLRGGVWWIKGKVNGRIVRESTQTHDRKKAELVLKAKVAEGGQRRLAVKMGLPVPEDLEDAKMTLAKFLEKYQAHYLNAGGPALRESRDRSWKADHWALDGIIAFLESKGVTKVAKVARRHVEAFRDTRLSTPLPSRRRLEVVAVRRKGGRFWLRYRIEGRTVREATAAKTREAADAAARARHAELEKEHPPRLPSAATVNKDLRIGRAAWSYAIAAGIARENPFRGVKPIKLPQYEPRNLGETEIRKVLETAKGEDAFPLLATALYAGLRLAELIALEWADVDFGPDGEGAQEGGTVRVRCSETFHTKSRKPRTVPLAPELRAILWPIRSTMGLCFPSAAATPRDRVNVAHSLQRISAKAGVRFSIHDLRRTFAGLLAAQGVPAWRIRDYLGHASIATTEGYYIARGKFEAADVAGLRFGAVPQGKTTAKKRRERKGAA